MLRKTDESKASLCLALAYGRHIAPDESGRLLIIEHLHENECEGKVPRPQVGDNLKASANPELCSLTRRGQLRLPRGSATRAWGPRGRRAGTLIDGRDAYQPRRVTDT